MSDHPASQPTTPAAQMLEPAPPPSTPSAAVADPSQPTTPAAQMLEAPVPVTAIRRSHAAQQAGIIASMARAHEKMLREIYYQKLKRGQIRQMELENQDLKVRVATLEHAQSLKKNFGAKQAGIIASMAKAHEKMLREIYYQKLQRNRNKEMERENAELKTRLAEVEQGHNMRRNFGAQQAGIIASMAKAHEKMLREIYYQKLQRKKNKENEGLVQQLQARVQELEAENETSRNKETRDEGIARQLQARVQELEEATRSKSEDEGLVRQLQARVRELEEENAASKNKDDTVRQLQERVQQLEKENKAANALVEDMKELAAAASDHSDAAQALVAENNKLKQDLEAAKNERGGGSSGEVEGLLKANKRLEIENMRLERRVHELEGIPVRPGSPVDDRLHDLEHRVRELELSPRASPLSVPTSAAHGGHSPMPSMMPPLDVHSPAAHSPHVRSPVAQSPVNGHSPHGAPKPFTVRVACDVHGVKYNVRLSFIGIPTMNTLINAVDNYFDVVARVNHPPGCPDVPFSLAALQIFDINMQKWVNLTDPFMITDDAQLFAFQPASVWHPDRPGTIPVPESVETWTALSNGPKRTTVPDVPNKSVMIINVFKDMDCMNEGMLRFTDLRDALLRYGMELTTSTTGELFTRIDKKKDGVITTDEWVEYCRENPRFVEAVYCKANDARALQHMPHYPTALSPSQYERFQSLREAQADRRPMSLSHSPRY